LDGAVVLPLVGVSLGAVGESEGIIRVELNCLIKVLDGAVVIALVAVGIAAVGEGGSGLLFALLARIDDRRARIDDDVQAGFRPKLAMLVVKRASVPLLVAILGRFRSRQQERDNR
jgi:hypothetical protein